MQWHSERTGIAFITLHMLLWGLFPVFAKSTFENISPLWSVGIGTLASVLPFAVIVTVEKEWRNFSRALQSKGIWMNTMFNGVFFYALFYIGLRTTAAGNASIVALFEVVTTIIILGMIRRSERMTFVRIIGSLLIVMGVLIILIRNAALPQGGELLIFLATFLVPLGNLGGKDARLVHSTAMILLVRSIISGTVLCVLAWMVDGLPSAAGLRAGLPVILLVGVFLLGLAKIFWMESIHRIQIGTAVSLSSLSPIITLLTGVFLLSESIRLYHFFALLPVLIGIRLVVRQPRLLQSAQLEI
jgi:drug/metabolite transporter (DMT)-like permease